VHNRDAPTYTKCSSDLYFAWIALGMATTLFVTKERHMHLKMTEALGTAHTSRRGLLRK
jgi:hypothetical protein